MMVERHGTNRWWVMSNAGFWQPLLSVRWPARHNSRCGPVSATAPINAKPPRRAPSSLCDTRCRTEVSSPNRLLESKAKKRRLLLLQIWPASEHNSAGPNKSMVVRHGHEDG
jgi:hypothetical protein